MDDVYNKYKYKYNKYKYKYKYLQNRNLIKINKINFLKYDLIGIGDFSHGDDNIWEFRLEVLKHVMTTTDKMITIFIEDTSEHTDNIMNDDKLLVDDAYDINENGFAYGPLWRYCYRSWDSPIFLKIIKIIRKNLDRITIIGVDIDSLARDHAMAKNILKKLNKNNINFFYGANAHVDAREITELYELKWAPEEKYRCGYYLKESLGDKYCIIISSGYAGSIRFGSVCDNLECDTRTFTKIPFYENIIHDLYKKYQTNNEYDIYEPDSFTDDIIEYTEAKFPNKYFQIKTNEWNYLIFFTQIRALKKLNTN